jgi:hypothetical protein
MVIVDSLHGALPADDRFAGAGKVMSCFVPRLLAGDFSAPNRVLKPPPLGITKQRLKISRAPILRPMLIEALEFFKRGLGGWEGVVRHSLRSTRK